MGIPSTVSSSQLNLSPIQLKKPETDSLAVSKAPVTLSRMPPNTCLAPSHRPMAVAFTLSQLAISSAPAAMAAIMPK